MPLEPRPTGQFKTQELGAQSQLPLGDMEEDDGGQVDPRVMSTCLGIIRALG